MVGAKVRELREAKGWTQEQLAEKCGLTRVTISLIETGKTKEIMSGTVKAIASALEVPVDVLFFT